MIQEVKRHSSCSLEEQVRLSHYRKSLRQLFTEQEWTAFCEHYQAVHDLSSHDFEDLLQGLCKVFGLTDHCDRSDLFATLEEQISRLIARRQVELQFEERVATAVEEHQREYWEEIRKEVLRSSPTTENAHTLKKYAQLELLKERKLGVAPASTLRPQVLTEVIGQDLGIEALIAKLASPFPQHILIYGPPGVGKTSAARLALEKAIAYKRSRFGQGAPFIEVDATSLHRDPRDLMNPLLGSVHDPIYQGARKSLAEHSVPEPKTGLVTDAHGGVLFIDEIGELDAVVQAQLLKVLEDKRVHFQSSYFDPQDERVPLYIKQLFKEGAPADFILVGATTRQPQDLDPALRSRCAEIFFRPLGPYDVEEIVQTTAQRMGAQLAPGAAKLIARQAMDGRKAVGLLSDAYARASMEIDEEVDAAIHVSSHHVQAALRSNRTWPVMPNRVNISSRVGRVFGLGVQGFVGQLMEFEAVAFSPGEGGEGTIRFNDSAGQMTKDSVNNAISILRHYANLDLRQVDLHVNIIGGGKVDGPSAGVALCLVMASAVLGKAVPQGIACTGEISLQGEVRAVGGIAEKTYAALYAGIKTIYIPLENLTEVPTDIGGLQVVGISHISEILSVMTDE